MRPRPRRGATAVEFALIAPLLMLLVFGLVEFGRMMMVKQCLSQAAQVGARTACLATTRDAARVDAAVRNVLAQAIPRSHDASLVKVSVTPSSLAGVSSGNAISVGLEVALSTVSWAPIRLLDFLGNPTISADAVQDRE